MARARPEPMHVVRQRRDAAFAALVDGIPYAQFLGITLERRGDELTGVLNFDDKLIGNPFLPALHGGVISAFLETTAILTLAWQHFLPLIEAGDIEVESLTLETIPNFPKTIDFTVDYLRTGLPRDAYARAWVGRAGRRYATVRVEAWQDSRSKPFAQGTGHFLMPQPRDSETGS
ncbi:PaaI family thioesterase [Ruegeria sp. 2012CJ41-6]|uniref:PaaI family thioesterase n=1 Tax=Ruegeria spongiae TaxID=2942209 RepID=A0ABT0Q3Q7_9RHOB|nr:PaaI family thioesterase [Ruegeria spongiae]MCL6284072.1 PaaI family thioesterase [Ruegeria spongiae]